MLKARPQHRSVKLWDGSRRVHPARYGNAPCSTAQRVGPAK
jgi:hypothetical protein